MTRARDLADSADKDIAGTLTLDGLTVETDNASIVFTGTTGNNFITAKQGLRIDIDSDNNQGATSFGVTRDGGLGNVLNANEDGDVTLYASDGSTAKFFWDASAESLGIGTSSVQSNVKMQIVGEDGASGAQANVAANELFVDNNGNTGVTVGTSNTGVGYYAFADSDVALRAGIFYNHTDDAMGFRVLSTEAMRIDSSGNVGIGTSSVDSLLHLQKSDATAYSATAADGQVGVGPTIYLENPANSNATVGGQILFGMRDTEEQARIGATGGTAPALTFGTGDVERMRLNATGKLSLGTDLTNADNSLLHITSGSTDNFAMLQLENTNTGSATAPDIAFYRNSASPADSDNIGALHFYGNNSVGVRTLMGQFYNRIIDVTDGSEDSKFDMYAMQAGSLAQFLTVGSNASGTGEVCVNEGSADINFRVETDANANAFVVDAGANFIGMHVNSALAPNGYTEQVRIASDGTNLGGSVVMSSNNNTRIGNSSENDLVFYDQDTSLTNAQGIGNIRWYSTDTSGGGEGFKIGIKGRGNATGSAYFQFYASSTASNYIHAADLSGNIFQPGGDNTSGLGQSSKRWTDVWAVDGSINTSDERLKQQVAALSTNEINAAKAISALFKTYKWNDRVAEKGDNARIHSGVIAQQVKAAMEANSLDPMKYAFMCWNEFYEKEMSGEDIATPYVETFEVDDPEIPEGATYVDRYSIRYSELMSFIHAATEQRLASIETRLDALEAE